MYVLSQKVVALALCALIVLPPVGEAAAQQASNPARSAQTLPLREYLQKPYLELFELAPKLEFSAAEIEAQRDALESGKDMCVDRFENHVKQYGKQIEASRTDLKKKRPR
jgi:hypothetical protein